MRYQTPVFSDAARLGLAIGYPTVQQPTRPVPCCKDRAVPLWLSRNVDKQTPTYAAQSEPAQDMWAPLQTDIL